MSIVHVTHLDSAKEHPKDANGHVSTLPRQLGKVNNAYEDHEKIIEQKRHASTEANGHVSTLPRQQRRVENMYDNNENITEQRRYATLPTRGLSTRSVDSAVSLASHHSYEPLRDNNGQILQNKDRSNSVPTLNHHAVHRQRDGSLRTVGPVCRCSMLNGEPHMHSKPVSSSSGYEDASFNESTLDRQSSKGSVLGKKRRKKIDFCKITLFVIIFILAVGSGLFGTLYYFLNYKPEAVTMNQGDVKLIKYSTWFCSAVVTTPDKTTIEIDTPRRLTVLTKQPGLQVRYNHKKSVNLWLKPGQHWVRNFYAIKGSQFKIAIDTTEILEVMIFEDESKLNLWISNKNYRTYVQQTTCWPKRALRNGCSNIFPATKDTNVFLVVYNSKHYINALTANVTLDFDTTINNYAKSDEFCVARPGESCKVKLTHGTSEIVSAEVPPESRVFKPGKVNWKCEARIWMYIVTFGGLFLGVTIFVLLIYCFIQQCRQEKCCQSCCSACNDTNDNSDSMVSIEYRKHLDEPYHTIIPVDALKVTSANGDIIAETNERKILRYDSSESLEKDNIFTLEDDYLVVNLSTLKRNERRRGEHSNHSVEVADVHVTPDERSSSNPLFLERSTSNEISTNVQVSNGTATDGSHSGECSRDSPDRGPRDMSETQDMSKDRPMSNHEYYELEPEEEELMAQWFAKFKKDSHDFRMSTVFEENSVLEMDALSKAGEKAQLTRKASRAENNLANGASSTRQQTVTNQEKSDINSTWPRKVERKSSVTSGTSSLERMPSEKRQRRPSTGRKSSIPEYSPPSSPPPPPPMGTGPISSTVSEMPDSNNTVSPVETPPSPVSSHGSPSPKLPYAFQKDPVRQPVEKSQTLPMKKSSKKKEAEELPPPPNNRMSEINEDNRITQTKYGTWGLRNKQRQPSFDLDSITNEIDAMLEKLQVSIDDTQSNEETVPEIAPSKKKSSSVTVFVDSKQVKPAVKDDAKPAREGEVIAVSEAGKQINHTDGQHVNESKEKPPDENEAMPVKDNYKLDDLLSELMLDQNISTILD